MAQVLQPMRCLGRMICANRHDGDAKRFLQAMLCVIGGAACG
jgi:hypothetical protein